MATNDDENKKINSQNNSSNGGSTPVQTQQGSDPGNTPAATTTNAGNGGSQQGTPPPLVPQGGVKNPLSRPSARTQPGFVAYDKFGVPISIVNGNDSEPVAYMRPVVGENEREYRKNNPNPELSKEEQEKQRKKERRQKIIAAVGDGISSIANLVNARNYAPDMYNGKSPGGVEKVESRWDKLKKEYKENLEKYRSGLEKSRQTDYARWLQNVQLAQAQRKMEIDEKNKADKAKRDDLMAQAKVDRYNAASSQDYAKIAYYDAKIDALREGATNDAALKAARAAEAYARTELNKAKAKNETKYGPQRYDQGYTDETTETTTSPSGRTTTKNTTTTRKPSNRSINARNHY